MSEVTSVPLMMPVDLQLANEYSFSKFHIDGYIQEELLASEAIVQKIDESVVALEAWLEKEFWPKKQERVNQIKPMDLHALAMSVYTATAYLTSPTLFTAITAEVASRLNFTDKSDAIHTVAEIMTVLAYSDLYDIYKEDKHSSLMVSNNVNFSQKLKTCIERSVYLPPMVCEPEMITHNRQSGHLTHDVSVILKGGNHHDDPVALDVINIMNQTPLTINQEFLDSVEELPTFLLDSVQKLEDWQHFKCQSFEMYELIRHQTDHVWFDYAYDKRGRLYPRGYHISPMGTAYKKAMLEFAEKELVHVPDEFKAL